MGQEVDVSAAPGPCTSDDVAANRWSTRVTVTNPADAGPLDYVALAVNFSSADDSDLPNAGPLHLAAGETGSLVLTAPGDYFPDAIIVGGGISADGESAQTYGEVDIFDESDFLKVAKVCGTTTPTPDPIDSDPTDAASGDSGDPTQAATSTVTVTPSFPARHTEPGEPPTPSPYTTHLGVTG